MRFGAQATSAALHCAAEQMRIARAGSEREDLLGAYRGTEGSNTKLAQGEFVVSEQSQLPRGGVDLRKYAAVTLALALTRGALFDALDGNLEGVQRILDLTATSTIAQALGCTESDLAIIWYEYLTPTELERIQGF